MFPLRKPIYIDFQRPRTQATDKELAKMHPCERLEILRARSQNGPKRKRNKKQRK